MEKDERPEQGEPAPVLVEPEEPTEGKEGGDLWRKVGTGLLIATLVGFVLFLARGGRGGTT